MKKHLRPSLFKRFIAIIIDFIVLGALGFISGLVLEEFYVYLGEYGTLFGSAIVIAYFGILQSNINEGQSIGKRVMDAQVLKTDGTYLSLEQSLLRAFVLYFPILNIELFASGKNVIIVAAILMIIIFGNVYFSLVNTSRRGLHDILSNAVTVKRSETEFYANVHSDKSMKKLLPIMIIGLLLLGTSISQMFSRNSFRDLLSVKHVLEQRQEVILVNKLEYKTKTISNFNSDQPAQTYSAIGVTVSVNNEEYLTSNDSRIFEEYYNTIKEEVPGTHSVDYVNVNLSYGYNIGIASKTRKKTMTF